MGLAIGIDVYGTLVDPQAISAALRPLTGERAESIAQSWRAKQLEYTFRRAAMRLYEDFAACTRQALAYALESHGVMLAENDQRELLEAYQKLPAHPDAAAGLAALKAAHHTLWGFSNGVAAQLDQLLNHAGLLEFLQGVITTGDVRSFKPDPRVYQYLAERLGRPAQDVWLISSNAFDVIGAKAAGMRALWIRRNPAVVFDRWAIEPDLTAVDFEDAARRLNQL